MHLVAGSDLKAMSHESSALAELQLLGGEPHTLGSMAGYAIWMMDPIRKVVTGLYGATAGWANLAQEPAEQCMSSSLALRSAETCTDLVNSLI